MAKSNPTTSSSSSSSSSLLPLIILLIVLSIVAFIGYAIYTVATAVADQTNKKMEQKNVVFTKDGMRVGVKHVAAEREADRTQSLLVNAWNYSTWPAYKSRFWNKEGQGQGQGGGPPSRPRDEREKSK